MQSALQSIAICGNGLAANMVVAALARTLDPRIKLLHLNASDDANGDLLYGHVTAPTAYSFLQSIGVDEPTLYGKTRSSFGFGTQYKTWSQANEWVQAYHLPFPLIEGIPLQHFLTRRSRGLGALLISAEAALAGRFAHPPEDPKSPLSRAEYGYQFSPAEWTACLLNARPEGRVQTLSGTISDVISDDAGRHRVRMHSGDVVEADLLIDCTGLSRRLISVQGTFERRYDCQVTLQRRNDNALGAPLRIVEGHANGWTATVNLQGAMERLSVGAPEDMGAESQHSVVATVGRVREAWIGNVVAIGHSAHVLEPLTPAPMMLLQRDIERLLELIPVSADTSAERREYNRRFNDDAEHAELFHNAVMIGSRYEEGTYWSDARRHALSPKLDRKIQQFEGRGLLAKYDLEPFNDEDWTILHFGVGRMPKRYDRQIDHLSDVEIDQKLNGLAQAVQATVTRMPPHQLYVEKMKRYFEKQGYV